MTDIYGYLLATVAPDGKITFPVQGDQAVRRARAVWSTSFRRIW